MDNKITITIQANTGKLDAAIEQACQAAFSSGFNAFQQALVNCGQAALSSARAFSELARTIQDYNLTVAVFEAMLAREEQLAWRRNRNRVVARLGAGLSLALVLVAALCV